MTASELVRITRSAGADYRAGKIGVIEFFGITHPAWTAADAAGTADDARRMMGHGWFVDARKDAERYRLASEASRG